MKPRFSDTLAAAAGRHQRLDLARHRRARRAATRDAYLTDLLHRHVDETLEAAGLYGEDWQAYLIRLYTDNSRKAHRG